jgi:hypothetical protein
MPFSKKIIIMKRIFSLQIVCLLVFLLVNTIAFAQTFNVNHGIIRTVRLDTTIFPPRISIFGKNQNEYVSTVIKRSLNDAANTQEIRIGFGGCRITTEFRYVDTTFSFNARLPFGIKLYFDIDGANSCYPTEVLDSVWIRYNQILSTDHISQLSAQVSIAPNPNKGTFTIQHDAAMQIQTATIYDSRGALLQKIIDISDEIMMPTTMNGIYFIRLQTNRGEVIKKVLLE